MTRFRPWFVLLALGAVIAWGCSPEVLIARDEVDDDSAGAAAGGNPSEPVGGEGGQAVAGTSSESGAGSEPLPIEPTPLLADSVADFSLVQGERGWLYGYDNGSIDTFTLLPRISVITAYVPVSGDVWDCWVTADMHWTQIFQLGAHPNGTDSSVPSVSVEERAVRRWTSNYSGNIRITGELAKIDVTPGGSNGVDALILVDQLEVYSVSIGGEDAAGLSYEVNAAVRVGSTVDLVLDAHEGSDHHDLSRFTAVIERAASHSG